MFRRLIAAMGAALVLFHAWLLATQVWHGELLDTGVLLRWFAAAGLTAGLVGLYRAGLPVVGGRKAIALWLLAALLHAPATADLNGRIDAPALQEATSELMQAASAVALAGLGLLLLRALLGRTRRPASTTTVLAGLSLLTPLSPGFGFARSARPPPG